MDLKKQTKSLAGVKSPWPSLIGVLAFFLLSVVVFWFSLSFIPTPTDPTMLSTYFAKLQPGISYSNVMQSIPRAMVDIEKQPCTLLILSNSVPTYETRFHGNISRDPLRGVEEGSLYFDAHDKLIYMTYTQSGAGRWKPNWKVEKSN